MRALDRLPEAGRVLAGLYCVVLVGAAALATGTGAHAAASPALAAQNAGTWDLSFEKGNRRCRLMLKSNAGAEGYALGLPAGCHRAFPMLGTVAGWRPAEGDHVVFETASGQPALDFGPTGGPNLSAVASESDTYTLTPTDPARRAALRAAGPDTGARVELAAATAPRSAKPAAVAPSRILTTGEVAGRYAVLRKGKDTGCMVTLDDKARGPKTSLKAKLAPSCRDQGIVIFDPVGWQITKGQLVLIAKKGHTTQLSEQDDGTWANAPVKGRALALKRL